MRPQGARRISTMFNSSTHIPGIAALWEVATPEERREMVLLMLEPSGLYYDLELREIAALKPRPAFLPLMRMMDGLIEYKEATGTLVTSQWQRRNRRDSDDPQLPQWDRMDHFISKIIIREGSMKTPSKKEDISEATSFYCNIHIRASSNIIAERYKTRQINAVLGMM